MLLALGAERAAWADPPGKAAQDLVAADTGRLTIRVVQGTAATPTTGALVRVVRRARIVAEGGTGLDGTVSFDLDLGKKYRVIVFYEGLASKRRRIDFADDAALLTISMDN